jgi:membrane-associated phospholipid phosphatase
MPTIDTATLTGWHLLTRLGEAQILLPAAAVVVLVLLRQGSSRRLVGLWLALLAAAVAVTTATKLAFIGWGLGSSALDFTGVSGHAMFAAAVIPLLLAALVPAQPLQGRWLAVAGGVALALLVGWSRLEVQAHTVSEVLAGVVLGGAVSATVLWRERLPQLRLNAWLPLGMALWLLLTPSYAPPSHSHDMVTRLALVLSGHLVPHTRAEFKLERRGAV